MQPELKRYAKIITALHEHWDPHDGQVPIGKALFSDLKQVIFVQCGRKFGKTEILVYMLIRWALTHKGSTCYYISPFKTQSREILWASKRMQNFIPREFIKDVNNTEMRITLTNDSFIKADGSDNFEAFRGVNPHIVVYDEFKDFRPEFHLAMAPNLATFKAPLVIVGTPPEMEGQYTVLAEECKHDENKAFFEAPSWSNPYLDRAWLENEKKTLYARGDGNIWEREYAAKFVTGGPSSVFPMLDKAHKRPHAEVMAKIARDKKKLQWYCMADPGTTTCFAVLFVCVNNYTKEIICLDEIYETTQQKTSVTSIGRRILEKQNELGDLAEVEWMEYADEAAAWFMTEMADRYSKYFSPTHKSAVDKETGLSLIKDVLLANKITISDRCVNLFWEMQNYVKDKNGKIPKKNDHLIDCLRYLISIEGYSILGEYTKPRQLSDARFYTPEDDFKETTNEDSILGVSFWEEDI